MLGRPTFTLCSLLLAAVIAAGCMEIPTRKIEPTNRPGGDGDGDASSTDMDGGRDGSEAGPNGDGGASRDGESDACSDCVRFCESDIQCLAHQPVCGEDGRCTWCDDHDDCKLHSNEPVCVSGSCLECSNENDAACTDEKPVCNTEEGKCVECTAEHAEACTEESGEPHCKDGGNICVECNVSEDCRDADAPICGEDNKCRACSADSDCSPMGKICDESDGPFKGQCVECTQHPDDEARCDGFSCNPRTRTCTTREIGKTGICRSCTADSECQEDHRCIPMYFEGELRTPLPDEGGGGYCLKIAGTGCTRPYGATAIDRASISGHSATQYCGVNESKTTCEAILAYGSSCPGGDAAECGVEGARCERVNNIENTCTYSCDSGNSVECPGSNAKACPSGSNSYCGQN